MLKQKQNCKINTKHKNKKNKSKKKNCPHDEILQMCLCMTLFND